MKSNQTIIRKAHMEHFKNTTELLGIKNTIQLLTVLNPHPHIVINPKLDYSVLLCPHYKGNVSKQDFQKASKIPILDCQSFPTLLQLKKHCFQWKASSKVSLAQTPFDFNITKKSTNLVLFRYQLLVNPL